MSKVSNYIMPNDSLDRGHMRFEEDLRKVRLSRGLDLDTIYKKTKIRPEVIDRLETSGLSDDPVFSTDIYKRPLIRNYAHGLGIDPDEVLRAFDMSENGEYDGFLASKYVDPSWKPEKKSLNSTQRNKADVSDVMDQWYPTTASTGIKPLATKETSNEPPAAIRPKREVKKDVKHVAKNTTNGSNEADPKHSKSGKKIGAKTSSSPPINPKESKPIKSGMDLNDDFKGGEGKRPPLENDISKAENLERPKTDPEPVKASPHFAPDYEAMEEAPKNKWRYIIPIAAVIAGVAIGGIFGPGLIAKFADKQPVTIKYSQAASFDAMPSLMKGVVETGLNEKTFVIVAIRKDASGRNDQFDYTLRTTTNGQLYSVNGTGQISPDRNRISIGDYGWGSIKQSPDGQFAIISVNEAEYPKWELTGK